MEIDSTTSRDHDGAFSPARDPQAQGKSSNTTRPGSRYHVLQQDETDSGLQTFLQKMSLRTGAEVITFLQVINKASGVYGLLALLTGAKIDGWQLSMYLYSTFALVATTFLYKHIRLQSPFESVLLAHLYALDSVINALYTAFFGIAWFYTLAAHPDENRQRTCEQRLGRQITVADRQA